MTTRRGTLRDLTVVEVSARFSMFQAFVGGVLEHDASITNNRPLKAAHSLVTRSIPRICEAVWLPGFVL